MVDLDRYFDIEQAAEAARLTGLDMIAIAEMVDSGTFDWVAAANLIKASRDRLEPFAELPPEHAPPDMTSASVEWINTIATRLARNFGNLFVRLKEVADSHDGLLAWKKSLLREIIGAVIDLRDLASAPNIQSALLPVPEFGRVVNPRDPDAN